jgi:hypothetical protein
LLGHTDLEIFIFSLQFIVCLRLGLKLAIECNLTGHHLFYSICEVHIVVCWTNMVHSSWGLGQAMVGRAWI